LRRYQHGSASDNLSFAEDAAAGRGETTGINLRAQS
jgi:hypothetical protein